MEKYQETRQSIAPLMKKMRTECIEFIKEVLKKNPDGIDLQQFEKDGGDSVCVTYDGGNHPEYASNAFSQVYMVKKDGTGSIIFETEDADIDIDYLETLEIGGVCDVIYDLVSLSD